MGNEFCAATTLRKFTQLILDFLVRWLTPLLSRFHLHLVSASTGQTVHSVQGAPATIMCILQLWDLVPSAASEARWKMINASVSPEGTQRAGIAPSAEMRLLSPAERQLAPLPSARRPLRTLRR